MFTAKRTILLVLAALSTGCTNYMYSGTMTAKDSEGVDREIVVYWPKTKQAVDGSKGGTLELMTQCGPIDHLPATRRRNRVSRHSGTRPTGRW